VKSEAGEGHFGGCPPFAHAGTAWSIRIAAMLRKSRNELQGKSHKRRVYRRLLSIPV